MPDIHLAPFFLISHLNLIYPLRYVLSSSFQRREIEAQKIKISECPGLIFLPSVWWTTSNLFPGFKTFSELSWLSGQSLNLLPSFSRSFMFGDNYLLKQHNLQLLTSNSTLSYTVLLSGLQYAMLSFAPGVILMLFCA